MNQIAEALDDLCSPNDSYGWQNVIPHFGAWRLHDLREATAGKVVQRAHPYRTNRIVAASRTSPSRRMIYPYQSMVQAFKNE